MKFEKQGYRDRKALYAQGQTWADDIHGALRASRRVAWIVAGVAAGIALMEAVALVALAPLKTVVPYTITVDRQTGYIDTAQGLKPGALSQDVAVNQAFLAQYVMAREGFDATDLQANYRKIAAWTVGAERERYIRGMAKTNPRSPVNLYQATTVVQTTIKSVSLLSPTSALVRFDTERVDAGGLATTRQPFAAVMGFRYSGAPMRSEDRFLNPLGFQVTAYRRDAESLGAAPVSQ